jgi:hypothetical protein
VIIGAGLGRPLILTTLEIGAAMRVLGRGRRGRVWLAAGLLVGGMAALAIALLVAIFG